jgi:hypothetical protein
LAGISLQRSDVRSVSRYAVHVPVAVAGFLQRAAAPLVGKTTVLSQEAAGTAAHSFFTHFVPEILQKGNLH